MAFRLRHVKGWIVTSRHMQDKTLGLGSHRGVVKIGFGSLVLAVTFSLAGFSPAQAQPAKSPLDASDVVAAQVDASELETAVESFDPGDADGAAELAAVVAPQDGVDLNDSELVNLSSDGGLVLDGENGVSVGLRVQGSTATPEIVDGAAVSAGVDTDLDVVSRATADGAQILAVLGNKNAPNEIGFDLDLPEGAKLATQADGSILISAPVESEVSLPGEDERIEAATLAILGTSAALDDGLDELTDEQIEQLAAIPDAKTKTIIETLPVAEIQTPWAVDANGNPVETRFELDVHTLTQIIETNNNTAYPVIADPSAKPSVGQILTCAAAIGALLLATYLSAAKILKIKKYIKAAGGAKTAAKKMMKSYGKYKKAVAKAKSKGAKPPKLLDFMSKDLKNVQASLAALVTEILGLNGVRKACFAW